MRRESGVYLCATLDSGQVAVLDEPERLHFGRGQ